MTSEALHLRDVCARANQMRNRSVPQIMEAETG